MEDSEQDQKSVESDIPDVEERELEDELLEAEIDAVVFDSSAVASIAELIKACTEAIRPIGQSEVYDPEWPPGDFRKTTMKIYNQVPRALKKILNALGD